ncbi:MAG: hypothetical protein JWO11_3046 [Nocardioides sp.]|nr:hypothetical protein [Nocardioides sp.]
MTDVPPEVPLDDLAEDLAEDQADHPADPEEYEADEAVVVSPDTGTVYDETGEPALTPHDVTPVDEEP